MKWYVRDSELGTGVSWPRSLEQVGGDIESCRTLCRCCVVSLEAGALAVPGMVKVKCLVVTGILTSLSLNERH